MRARDAVEKLKISEHVGVMRRVLCERSRCASRPMEIDAVKRECGNC